MDLNELLYRHQLALMSPPPRPSVAGPVEEGCNLVRHYAGRIARLRREMGVHQYPACQNAACS